MCRGEWRGEWRATWRGEWRATWRGELRATWRGEWRLRLLVGHLHAELADGVGGEVPVLDEHDEMLSVDVPHM